MLKLRHPVLRLTPTTFLFFLLFALSCSSETPGEEEGDLSSTASEGTNFGQEGGVSPDDPEGTEPIDTGSDDTVGESTPIEEGTAPVEEETTPVEEEIDPVEEEVDPIEEEAEEPIEEPAVEAVNAASIVTNSLPGSLACGATAGTSLVVRNTGTTTWTRADGYKLGIVEDEDPLYQSGTRVWLPEDAEIPPNAEWTFTFDLEAPTQSGVFFSDWQMVHEGVEWFGEIASSDVAVDCPATEVPGPTEYTEADEVEVLATAKKVKLEHPEFFDIEDLDDLTKRTLAYDMMTLNLNDLRSKGVNASRCVANPGLPQSDPFHWCSDALVVGSPGIGTTIDIYQNWSYPGKPQTAITEDGGQTGVITDDLVPLP